jgi:hypothetical protein
LGIHLLNWQDLTQSLCWKPFLIGWDDISLAFDYGWSQNTILPISASHIAGTKDVNHCAGQKVSVVVTVVLVTLWHLQNSLTSHTWIHLSLILLYLPPSIHGIVSMISCFHFHTCVPPSSRWNQPRRQDLFCPPVLQFCLFEIATHGQKFIKVLSQLHLFKTLH